MNVGTFIEFFPDLTFFGKFFGACFFHCHMVFDACLVETC